MKFEEYSGKKCAIITDAGYIYSQDKKKKTKDKAIAAEWYGCKEDDLLLIQNGWGTTGVYFEEDATVPGAVKISYWKIKNCRPSDEEELSVERIGYFYLHNDGRVSYAVGCDPEHLDQPRRIRNRPYPANRDAGIETWWVDYCQNMCVMNREETWRGSPLGTQVIEMLKRQGFPMSVEAYTSWTIKLEDDRYTNFGTLADWIKYYPGKKKAEETKEFKSLREEGVLEPLKEDTWIKVERTKEGVLVRMKELIGYGGKEVSELEKFRYLFTQKGTCSRQYYDSSDMKWHTDHSKETYYFYDTFRTACKKHKDENWLEGELKDLFIDNKKFKYLNDFINKYANELFCYLPKDGVYNYTGIIEFLRLYNKYPAFIDTMIKLGYFEDMVVQETETKATKTKYKYIDLYHFERIFSKRYGQSLLNQKQKDFFSALDANKFQWKVVRNLIKNYDEEDKEIKKHYTKKQWTGCCLKVFAGVYRFFCEEGAYRSLKEVPDNEFLEFIEVGKQIFKDRLEHPMRFKKATGGYNSYCDSDDSILCDLWEVIGRRTHAFINQSQNEAVTHIDQYLPLKIYRKAFKEGVDVILYSDYLSMRQSCCRYKSLGFDEKDWPEFPAMKDIKKFHDRITELHNEYRVQWAEKEESERNKMWHDRIKKEHLLKFEYEEGDRCIMLPKNLVDLIHEGQKLSHCVGSYTSSVAQGLETILFLRKVAEKETPYMTVDIYYDKKSKDWKMRQCHGYRNCDPAPEDVEFLKKWAVKNNVDEKTIKDKTGMLCAL